MVVGVHPTESLTFNRTNVVGEVCTINFKKVSFIRFRQCMKSKLSKGT